jgi:hypothetical protein
MTIREEGGDEAYSLGTEVYWKLWLWLDQHPALTGEEAADVAVAAQHAAEKVLRKILLNKV